MSNVASTIANYRKVSIIKSKVYNNSKLIHALFYVILFNITVAIYAKVCCGLLVARCDGCIQCTAFQCIIASVQCVCQCTLAVYTMQNACTHACPVYGLPV